MLAAGDSALVADRRNPPAGWLQAFIDEANPSRITGWLWDPQQPQLRIAVDVFDGDLRLMQVTADQYRSDLKQSGIGDGKHAFVVPLRPELLPKARNVFHVRVADTGAELPGSPVTIDRAGLGAERRPPALSDRTAPPRALTNAPRSGASRRRSAVPADEERIFTRRSNAASAGNGTSARRAALPDNGGDPAADFYSTIDFAGPSGSAAGSGTRTTRRNASPWNCSTVTSF